MSDIKLDTSTHDAIIENGDLVLTTGKEAHAQRIKQRILLIFGEWFLDRSRGIPYFTQVLVKNPNPVLVDAVFKNEVISDPSVLELQEFEIDIDNATREMNLKWKARTKEGDITFDENITAQQLGE